jgi:hypothetical protein
MAGGVDSVVAMISLLALLAETLVAYLRLPPGLAALWSLLVLQPHLS